MGCVFSIGRSKTSKRILVLDCDDTLYRNDGKMGKELSNNIEKYGTDKLNLEAGTCKKLYKKHGTTLNGLLKEGLIQMNEVDDFLEEVHTFPNEGRDLIKPDEKLRSFLLKVKVEMFIFTASVQSHAERCCRALGVGDLILSDSKPIIDTRTCSLNSKYDMESFLICLQEMSNFLRTLVDTKDLIFADDNLKNIQCAKKCGWGVCILVGARPKPGVLRTTELEGVDYVVEHLSELESIPELQDLFE